MQKLQIFLDRRAPGRNTLTSKRSENDKPEFVSGLFDGKTCGAPIAALIYNEDVKSEDYDDIKDSPRPSHADFTAQCKFRAYQDYRGGGHFSGRLTAALCVAGGIAIQMLERNGITVKAALETAIPLVATSFVVSRGFLAESVSLCLTDLRIGFLRQYLQFLR